MAIHLGRHVFLVLVEHLRHELQPVPYLRPVHVEASCHSLGKYARRYLCRLCVVHPHLQYYLCSGNHVVLFRMSFLAKLDEIVVGGKEKHILLPCLFPAFTDIVVHENVVSLTILVEGV